MKTKTTDASNNDMLPEYDLSGKTGVRGKHARSMREGYTVTIHKDDGSTLVQNFSVQENAVVLDSDVRAYFPTSESVNKALRSLIALIPDKRQSVREDKTEYGK